MLLLLYDGLLIKRHIAIACQIYVCYTPCKGNHRAKGGFTPLALCGGYNSPLDERKEGDAVYVTYQDLIQIGIFIVALANLIYQVYKGKKK